MQDLCGRDVRPTPARGTDRKGEGGGDETTSSGQKGVVRGGER